jgi:hypothetical protein
LKLNLPKKGTDKGIVLLDLSIETLKHYIGDVKESSTSISQSQQAVFIAQSGPNEVGSPAAPVTDTCLHSLSPSPFLGPNDIPTAVRSGIASWPLSPAILIIWSPLCFPSSVTSNNQNWPVSTPAILSPNIFNLNLTGHATASILQKRQCVSNGVPPNLLDETCRLPWSLKVHRDFKAELC